MSRQRHEVVIAPGYLLAHGLADPSQRSRDPPGSLARGGRIRSAPAWRSRPRRHHGAAAMIGSAELRETAFDPVFGAQPMFRRLLEATARPGLVVPLGDVPLLVPPARLRPASVLLLALMDREVTFAVVGPDAEMVREYLRFNTRAHRT